MKILKLLTVEQLSFLGTTNLFFLLAFLFGYSPLSLIFLFGSFLLLAGIILHIFYRATNEDDYDYQFSIAGSDKSKVKKPEIPHYERHEYIAPHTLFKVILSAYKILLTLVLKY